MMCVDSCRDFGKDVLLRRIEAETDGVVGFVPTIAVND